MGVSFFNIASKGIKFVELGINVKDYELKIKERQIKKTHTSPPFWAYSNHSGRVSSLEMRVKLYI
ncbi:MAG: hypothetical protein FD143_2747 [Ignavibacteria bacterium]|nr:MAG: hypothetical protein FD143_2747 [Ignavibacteria bacterium]KAF0161423.1 MAG: hypothetical protein FD188_794 [Ignavibacteria bacterium]